MSLKITVNGREYSSVEEMPPVVRKIYELAMKHVPGAKDVDGDGVLDPPLQAAAGTRTMVKQIVVDGTTYRSLDEVPPDMRPLIEQAMKAPGGTTVKVSLPSRSDPSAGVSLTQPIDPAGIGSEGGIRRLLLFIAVLVAVVWGAWLMFRAK